MNTTEIGRKAGYLTQSTPKQFRDQKIKDQGHQVKPGTQLDHEEPHHRLKSPKVMVMRLHGPSDI